MHTHLKFWVIFIFLLFPTFAFAQNVEFTKNENGISLVTEHWWELLMILVALLIAFWMLLRSRNNKNK